MDSCRDHCRWAYGCSAGGSETQDPDLCPIAWKLEEYWEDAKYMEEKTREMDLHDKYADELPEDHSHDYEEEY